MQFKKIEEKQYEHYKLDPVACKDNLVNPDYFERLLKDTTRVENLIKQLEDEMQQHRMDKFSNLLVKTIKNVEEMVHKLKVLPINFGIDSSLIKNSIYLSDTDMLYIEKEEEDTYKIVFRDLLPRRMKNGHMTENLDYLRNQYYTAFEKFFSENKQFTKYTERVVIIYKNYFCEVNGIMDDDNFDIKIITDFISQYMLIDDNPVRCMKIFDYGMDEHKHSEITIMPQKRYFEKLQKCFIENGEN